MPCGKVLDEYGNYIQGSFRSTNNTMKLLIILLIAIGLGWLLSIFLDPAFPSLLEIIDNPKF